MHIGKVNILGTSGGAWIAVNTALKRPDLTEKVIADSFDGRTLHETFAEDLLKERRAAMQDPSARQFYQWCQGEDWESIVELNTQALVKCAADRVPLSACPLRSCRFPSFSLEAERTLCAAGIWKRSTLR